MTNREWGTFIFQLSRLKSKCQFEMALIKTADESIFIPLVDIIDTCQEWIDSPASDFHTRDEVIDTMIWANLAYNYLKARKFNGYVEQSQEWA